MQFYIKMLSPIKGKVAKKRHCARNCAWVHITPAHHLSRLTSLSPPPSLAVLPLPFFFPSNFEFPVFWDLNFSFTIINTNNYKEHCWSVVKNWMLSYFFWYPASVKTVIFCLFCICTALAVCWEPWCFVSCSGPLFYLTSISSAFSPVKIRGVLKSGTSEKKPIYLEW